MAWSQLSGKRVDVAHGETISMYLYGHGAENATDAVGSGIHEWLGRKGTTTNYPNPTLMFGQVVAIGYVEVKIKAEASHGTGNRTVTVKWPTGNETIPVRIVATCAELSSFRTPAPTAGGSTAGASGASGGPTFSAVAPPLVGGTAPAATFVDIAPRANILNIFRRIGSPITLSNGNFLRVDDRWCATVPIPSQGNIAQTVVIPNLVWGVTNVGTAPITAAFAAELKSGNTNLQAQTIGAGSLAPGATIDFQYARTKSSARVIRFAPPQPQGCYVNPTSPEFFEDPPLTVVVDTNGVVAESNETNNSRSF
jgi:hypothetical protein